MADTEREAFEAKYRGLLDLTPCAENDGYMAYSTYCAWRAWKDRGAALASRPAEVDDEPQAVEPLDVWVVNAALTAGHKSGLMVAARICDETLWKLRDEGREGAECCGECSEAIRDLIQANEREGK